MSFLVATCSAGGGSTVRRISGFKNCGAYSGIYWYLLSRSGGYGAGRYCRSAHDLRLPRGHVQPHGDRNNRNGLSFQSSSGCCSIESSKEKGILKENDKEE
jgi:hypothetical protein